MKYRRHSQLFTFLVREINILQSQQFHYNNLITLFVLLLHRFISYFVDFISQILLINFTYIFARYSNHACGLYGQPPCSVVPAPSGVTPICATPGKTYCEQVQEYPAWVQFFSRFFRQVKPIFFNKILNKRKRTWFSENWFAV